MFVLYEDGGSFKAGLIKSETDASLQVEASSGKRSKIKRASCILTFEAPNPDDLLQQAPEQAADIDPAFLWEVAPQEEFDVCELATDYYGKTPTSLEIATLLWCLHDAPIYFHRRGKGKYRAAPPDILQAALAAQEKNASSRTASPMGHAIGQWRVADRNCSSGAVISDASRQKHPNL